MEALDTPWDLPLLAQSLLKYLRADDVGLMVEKYLRLINESQGRHLFLEALVQSAALRDVYWHLESFLQDKKARLTDLHGEAGRAVKRLGFWDRGTLNALLEKGRYAEAIDRIVQEAKEPSPGQGRYRQVLWSFIHTFKQQRAHLPADTLKETTLFLLACLIRLLEDVPEWSSADRTERLLDLLHYDGELLLENELIEKELPARRAEVAEPLLEILKQERTSVATVRAVGALGQMREARAVPLLLEILNGDDDFVNKTCGRALEEIGPPVLSHAEAVLSGDHIGQKISLLGVLAQIPCEEAVDLLLKHYETLIREIPDVLLSTLENLGSRRALPLIERDIDKGERLFDDAFVLLCELHDVKHPKRERLRAESERRRKRDEVLIAKAETDGFESLLMDVKDPLFLKLECRACGRVYTYQVEEVLVSPEQMKRKDAPTDSAFFIRERIVCKNCGAEDDYRFASEAMVALMAELMRVGMLRQQKGDVPLEDQRVKLVDFRLMDGTRCSPREALHLYQQRIEADPKNPELHDRIGCVYRLWRRYDQAITHFQRAMALDPERIATLYHLAELYREMGREKEAIRAMEEFLNRAAKKPKLTREEREYFEATKEMFGLPDDFGEIRLFDPDDRSLGRAKPMVSKERLGPQPMLKKERVSLNAPCPCGSGKKYKRCCARA
jgi:tetratricopeptide (TPR) repeat protein